MDRCVRTSPVQQCCVDYDYSERKKRGWGVCCVLSQQLAPQQPQRARRRSLALPYCQREGVNGAITAGCAGQGIQTGLDQWVLRLKVIRRGWESCRQQARHQLQRLRVLGLAAPGKAWQGKGRAL